MKKNGRGGEWMTTGRHKVTLSIFFFTDFSCDLGFLARLESGSSTL
jgi:hypothetical protein